MFYTNSTFTFCSYIAYTYLLITSYSFLLKLSFINVIILFININININIKNNININLIIKILMMINYLESFSSMSRCDKKSTTNGSFLVSVKSLYIFLLIKFLLNIKPLTNLFSTSSYPPTFLTLMI